MNEVINTIKSRRAVRSFLPRPVEREKIDEIVEAGLYAPSGMNRQERAFIVITDKETRDEVSRINASVMKSDRDPFYGAPVVIIVCTKKGFTNVQDGSAAIENMLVAASSLGLSSCWVHRAKEEIESEWGRKMLEKLALPSDYEGIGNIALGYSDVKAEASPRKPGQVFFIQ